MVSYVSFGHIRGLARAEQHWLTMNTAERENAFPGVPAEKKRHYIKPLPNDALVLDVSREFAKEWRLTPQAVVLTGPHKTMVEPFLNALSALRGEPFNMATQAIQSTSLSGVTDIEPVRPKRTPMDAYRFKLKTMLEETLGFLMSFPQDCAPECQVISVAPPNTDKLSDTASKPLHTAEVA